MRLRHRRRLALGALVLATPVAGVVRSSLKDNCIFSCRYRAAQRLPSWRPPLTLVPCALPAALAQRCRARNATQSMRSRPVPRFVVAITTLPGRGEKLIHAVRSLLENQRVPPERILVSAPVIFDRLPGTSANSSIARLTAWLQHRDKQPGAAALPIVEVLTCPRDDGPGTKLLCALPRLSALAAAPPPSAEFDHATPARGPLYVVLADDDLVYRPWAVQRLHAAATEPSADVDAQASTIGSRDSGSHHHHPAVIAYDVYTLMDVGRAVTGGMHPGLLVASGHALVAVRVDVLGRLQRMHGGDSSSSSDAVGGVEAFYRCVVAHEPRAWLHDDVWLSMWLQDVRRLVPLRISGTPYEMAARTFPEPHGETTSIDSPHALNALDLSAARAAWAAETKDKELRAAQRRAANASSVDRGAVNVALANVRRRIRSEGLCGISRQGQTDASAMVSCVGEWCRAAKARDWGAHFSKVPAWP